MRRTILILRNSLSPTSFEGSEEAGAAFFYACGMSWQPGSSLKKERKKNSEKSRVFSPGSGGGGYICWVAGCRAPSAALVYCRAAGASQAAADMMGPGRSGHPVAGRWQPRAKAALGSGGAVRAPLDVTFVETEESWTMCAIRA